jgi:hypothetical protein
LSEGFEMRVSITFVFTLLAAAAAAQEPVTAPAPAGDARPAAAPLPGRATREEATALLEPAVDVSQTSPRTAQAERTRSQSAQTSSTRVMDTLDLGTTSITGNQELPKVLYIVPWKRSDLGDLVGRPVNTLLDEVLAPIDPEVFERHLDYYETLYGASQQE